jgi:CO/xanthine dehydrogenase FAD-binding subunit
MAPIQAYHRPQTIAEALELLERSGVRTALLGGGTTIVAELAEQEIEEVVDLQDAGPTHLEARADRLALGAFVRLQTLVEDERVPSLLRDAAFREGPNTFRNQSTLGGVIASRHWESELLAALLVHDASLTVETTTGTQTISLADFLAGPAPGGIIVDVSVATGGATSQARVGRTPLDTAIVAALARRDEGGAVRLALTGIAPTPSLADPDKLDTLAPPGDFRGSSDYRKEIAAILARRAIEQLEE